MDLLLCAQTLSRWDGYGHQRAVSLHSDHRGIVIDNVCSSDKTLDDYKSAASSVESSSAPDGIVGGVFGDVSDSSSSATSSASAAATSSGSYGSDASSTGTSSSATASSSSSAAAFLSGSAAATSAVMALTAVMGLLLVL